MSTNYVVSSGEVSSGLRIDNSGDTILVSGGTVTETTVTGGTFTVTRNGIADTTMLTGYGRMIVNSYGAAANTVMGGDGGSYNSMTLVLSNANAGYTTVNSGGTFYMSNGAEAHETTVNSGGKVFIYGGTAFNAIVNSSGAVNNSSGTIYGATVGVSGSINNVGGNAFASNVYLNGNFGLSAGASANNVEVGPNGYIHLSGGTLTNVEIRSGGTLNQAGGRVETATVDMGGWMSAGFRWYGAVPETDGAAVIMENGGRVTVGSSSIYDYETSSYITKLFPVTFASNTFSGLTYSTYNDSGTIHSGTTAVDITAVGGGLTVFSGGIINGFKTGGSATYDEYGYRSYECGTLEVLAGGTATGIVADLPDSNDYYTNYLMFQIAPGTVVSATVDGSEFRTDIGVVENTTATKVALEFLSGATVTNLTQVQGSASVYVGAIVNDLTLSGTALNIESGAVVNGVKGIGVPVTDWVLVNPWGGGEDDPLEYVQVDVIRGAYVYVNSGATVTNMDLDADSPLTVYITSETVVSGLSGGANYDIKDAYFGNNKLDNTELYLEEGLLENLVVNNGGVVWASYGTSVLNMTENGGAVFVELDDPDTHYSFASNTFSGMALKGEVTVHQNTIASNNTLKGGTLNVYSGGIVRDFYAINGGRDITDINLSSGAIATNVDMTRYFTEGHGGHVQIDYGVNVSGLRLKSEDFVYLYLDSATVVENAAVDGKPFTFDGSVLSGFRINEGMNSDLYLGGGVTEMADIWVSDCPIYWDEPIHAVNVTLNQTFINLGDGDYFENLNVATGSAYSYVAGGTTYTNYLYGSATVQSGAVVDGVNVNNGGTLIVSSGGKITGVMRFGSASTVVSCGSGAIIDFDVSDKSALYVARSNDWRFNGKNKDVPRYTITVDAQQGAGTYVLANSTYFSDAKNFYLLDSAGHQYGYFEGHFSYEIEDEKYVYKFESNYYGETISGLTLTLDAVRIDRDDIIDFDLVLRVESAYTAPKWVAAPTVTADNETFTCKDVVLTATYDESVVKKEYSLDGTNWTVFDGVYTAAENGIYSFRGTDAAGTVSDIVSYRVLNIDKVAPTTASDLSVAYDEDSNVILSWEDASDDYAGVSGFFVACWQDGGASFTQVIPGTSLTVDSLADGTWHWALQALDYAGNASSAVQGADFVISGGTVTPGPTPPPTPTYVAKADIDGNGVSDVLFQYTGGDYQLGYWMNGTNAWRGQGLAKPAEWEVLGSYDMNNNGNADAVLVGNVEVGGVKGAYIGYYLDSVDTDANWQNIGYLNNADNIGWKNKVGNLTGTAGANSIVWYAPELYALGAWIDGTDSWVTLSNSFGGDGWTMVGCGDFAGTGKDAVLMAYNGQLFYTVDITGTSALLTNSDLGWSVRSIGDFSGDGKDDIVAFHEETGLVAMWGDGTTANWSLLGQLDAADWFVVGAGDYNGDQMDDLLVRQYSTGMLGYYTSGDMSQWNVLGYGVDMNWTVIA